MVGDEEDRRAGDVVEVGGKYLPHVDEVELGELERLLGRFEEVLECLHVARVVGEGESDGQLADLVTGDGLVERRDAHFQLSGRP